MANLVAAPPVVEQDDRCFSVRLSRGMLVGAEWHEPGSVVTLPYQCAREALRSGAAVFSGTFARMVDWVERKLDPTPSAGPTDGEYYRLDRGSLFFGNRTYTPESGPFRLPLDVASRVTADFTPETQKRLGLDPAKCPVLRKVVKVDGK